MWLSQMIINLFQNAVRSLTWALYWPFANGYNMLISEGFFFNFESNLRLHLKSVLQIAGKTEGLFVAISLSSVAFLLLLLVLFGRVRTKLDEWKHACRTIDWSDNFFPSINCFIYKLSGNIKKCPSQFPLSSQRSKTQ